MTDIVIAPGAPAISKDALCVLLARGIGMSRVAAALAADIGGSADFDLDLADAGQELIDWLNASCYREVHEMIENGHDKAPLDELRRIQ